MKILRGVYLAVILSLTACNDVVEKFTSSDTDGAEDSEAGTASGSGEDWDVLEDELKAEKKELDKQIDDLEDALDDEDKLVKKELEIVGKLGEIRKYSDQVEKVHAETEKALDGWRQATRSSYKGVKLAKIETIGGVVYSGVTITNVTDDTVTIEHSGGMDTVDISQLTVQLRKNLIHETTVLVEKEL